MYVYSVKLESLYRSTIDPSMNVVVQAKEITISQNPPSGVAPEGSFYSTQNLTHEFFEPAAEARRDERIKKDMSFLHSLITAKLSHAEEIRAKKRTEDEDQLDNPSLISSGPNGSRPDVDVALELNNKAEGVLYQKPSNQSINLHRLEKVVKRDFSIFFKIHKC